MVRTEEEQEAFEKKLWKEEAGEFICIKNGVKNLTEAKLTDFNDLDIARYIKKHLGGDHFHFIEEEDIPTHEKLIYHTVNGDEKYNFYQDEDGVWRNRVWQEEQCIILLLKAKKEFEKALLLEEEFKKQIEIHQGYREGDEQIERLSITFIRTINQILTFINHFVPPQPKPGTGFLHSIYSWVSGYEEEIVIIPGPLRPEYPKKHKEKCVVAKRLKKDFVQLLIKRKNL